MIMMFFVKVDAYVALIAVIVVLVAVVVYWC